MLINSKNGKSFINPIGIIGASIRKYNDLHTVEVFYKMGMFQIEFENEMKANELIEFISKKQMIDQNDDLEKFKDGIDYAIKLTQKD